MKTQLRLACLSLLAVICLALTAVPAVAQNDLYDNGPVNGEVDGWQINNGNGVSDSFSCQSSPGLAPEAACKGTHIKEVSFYAWLEPGDTATGVEIAIGSAGYFSNNLFDGTVSLTQSHCFTNGLGFDVCQESGNFSGPALNAGNYYLTLENATTADGAPLYWDENSGVGCTSPGCPSQAQENGVGTIPSETFTLEGTPAGSTPEPNTMALIGSGFVGLAAFLRCKSRD